MAVVKLVEPKKHLSPMEYQALVGQPYRSTKCALCKMRDTHPELYDNIIDGWKNLEWRATTIIRYVRHEGYTGRISESSLRQHLRLGHEPRITL